MLGEIQRLNEREAENFQTRTWINADRANVDHAGTEIADLFRYWQERSFLENGLPKLSEFYPHSELLPWIDVESANPLNFILHNHPAGVCGNWESTRIADYPVTMHAKACAVEYLRCKMLRQPIYIHTHQKMMSVEREYAKLWRLYT